MFFLILEEIILRRIRTECSSDSNLYYPHVDQSSAWPRRKFWDWQTLSCLNAVVVLENIMMDIFLTRVFWCLVTINKTQKVQYLAWFFSNFSTSRHIKGLLYSKLVCKPVWLYFFCCTQKKIIWQILIAKPFQLSLTSIVFFCPYIGS